MHDLSPERCHILLREGKVGHLAVVDDEGPYVTPVPYVLVDRFIFVRTGHGRSVKAIREDPRVCMEVSRGDATGSWESVVTVGRAEILTDPDLGERVVAMLLAKYRQELGSPFTPGEGGIGIAQMGILVRIPIEQLTGRSSGDPLHIRTRPGRL